MFQFKGLKNESRNKYYENRYHNMKMEIDYKDGIIEFQKDEIQKLRIIVDLLYYIVIFSLIFYINIKY